MSSLRILALVTDAFGSLGGISKFNRDLLTALCAHPDCAEVVALPRLMPAAPGPLPANLTWVTAGIGGKLSYIRAVLRTGRSPRTQAPQPSTSWRAEVGGRRLNSEPSTATSPSFDLIICAHINLLPAAFLARRLSSAVASPSSRGPVVRNPVIPICLFIHGIDAWQPHRSALVRRLARRVDAVVSVSQFTLERFRQWSGAPAPKGLLLPNCVDLAGFRPGEKDPALLKKYGLAGRKVLMTLGRLLPDRPKGIDEVLELLPELAKSVPQIAYLIVGDGPDRPRLVQKARSLGLVVADYSADSAIRNPQSAIPGGAPPSGPRVAFTGRIPEPEKAAHYRLADAFVMPGYGEGFGIVYLEALACGLPVLASTLDASREALRRGELGQVVDPRDHTALHEGFLRVLKGPLGTVPAGLDYFSFPKFVQRCHMLLDLLCPAAAATSR